MDGAGEIDRSENAAGEQKSVINTSRIDILPYDPASIVDVVRRIIDCAAGGIDRAEHSVGEQECMSSKTGIDIVAHDRAPLVEPERDGDWGTRQIDVRVGVSSHPWRVDRREQEWPLVRPSSVEAEDQQTGRS